MRDAIERIPTLGADALLARSVRAGRPVVLTETARRWPAIGRWTPAFLRDACGGIEVFVRGSRRGLKDIGRVRLADYVDWLETGRFRAGGAPGGPALLARYPADHPVKPYVAYDARLAAALGADIDFPSLLPGGYRLRTTRFWLGPEGASTPLHADSWGWNLFLQVWGKKRFLLFPVEASPLLYPSDIFEPNTTYSRVDVTRPDLVRFPRYREARPIEVTLEPGELLVLPRRFWHDVESLTPSISVNAWAVSARDQLTASYLTSRARGLLHALGVHARGRCTCHLAPGGPDVGQLLGWDQPAPAARDD